jgi:nucleoside-diphosphate-sugar epimerase
MKIVVNGGTGLIGSKVVAILRQGGHEVVAGLDEWLRRSRAKD